MNHKEWLKLENQNINETYFFEKLIGFGGYGAVYRASEVVQNTKMRSLAVKVIKIDDPDNADKVQLTELQAAVNFDHPHLIRCFTCGAWQNEFGNYLYLVMELAESSLGKKLQEEKTLSTPTIRSLAEHIASALVYLHEQNFVHRDLKPDNILWVKDRWKLSDFGIIRKMSDRSITFTQNQKMTNGYAPPEAYDSEISTGWDIWSLGIVICQAFSGGLPYEFKTEGELIKRIIFCDLQIPTLPTPFDDLVKQCLQEEPRQRLTAKQVRNAVEIQPISVIVNPLILRLPNNQSLELVNIPSGELIIEGGNKVNLREFKMGKYIVTQAQYQAVMGGNLSTFQGNPQIPVHISKYELVEFLEKLSHITGKRVRLPSASEWQYACLAGSKTKYYFGDSDEDLGKYAWYLENAEKTTHPVGQKLPNSWGLYDMYGNAWEVCLEEVNFLDMKTFLDKFEDLQKKFPQLSRHSLAEIAFTNAFKTEEFLYGGSWYNSAYECCTLSNPESPEFPDTHSGMVSFRIVV